MKKMFFILTFLALVPSILTAQTEPTDTDSDGKREVSTLDNLLWISTHTESWGYSYEQTADIDASSTSGWGGGGFSPIGNSTTGFSGSYDGQGFKISYLYIDRSTDNIGFFGVLQSATISNLQTYHVQLHGENATGGLFGQAMSSTITNCSSTFYVNGKNSYTGGLGGYASNTTITGCYFSGDVYGGTVTPGDQNFTGGLIGEFSNSSTMTNCYFNGAVSGHNFTGGLIGTCNNSSLVSKCFSRGSVMGNNNTGGLIGYMSTKINNCYSRASVSVNVTGDNVGGLIGTLANDTLTNCYSTGAVSGISGVGGLVGALYSTPVINGCFWDTETSSCSTSAAGTGKTTAEMKTQSTFIDAGWSTSIWNMDTGNDGYPYFDWENPGGAPLPVELISFKAFVSAKNVLLKWETATEADNYGFEVERVKSEEFKEKSFQTIGFVPGAGNSSSPKNYSFADKNLGNGVYIYRLKQINTDGSFDYSNTVSAEIDHNSGKVILMQNFPNPPGDYTVITFTLPSEKTVTLVLYNAIGKETEVIVNKNFQAGTHNITLPVQKLPPGVYFYLLKTGGLRLTNKFAIVK